MNDITRFTQGDCIVLAKRINRITGWPIHAFNVPNESDPTRHAFVINPDGLVLDIYGYQTQDELIESWQHEDEEITISDPLTGSQIWQWEAPYKEYSSERARKIAPILIDGESIPETKIPNEPLREAFLNSGRTITSIARDAGFIDKRGRTTATSVSRALGLRAYKSGRGEWHINKNITIHNAERIARAIPVDPVDIGL